jgi:hypothetical protein
MAKMILIGEVANLARDIENKRDLFATTPMCDPTTGEGGKLVRFREFISTMHEEEGVAMHRAEEGVAATTPPASLQRKTPEARGISPPSTEGTTPKTPPSGPQGDSPRVGPPRPVADRIPRSSSDASGDRTVPTRVDSSPNVELRECSSVMIVQFVGVRSIPLTRRPIGSRDIVIIVDALHLISETPFRVGGAGTYQHEEEQGDRSRPRDIQENGELHE